MRRRRTKRKRISFILGAAVFVLMALGMLYALLSRYFLPAETAEPSPAPTTLVATAAPAQGGRTTVVAGKTVDPETDSFDLSGRTLSEQDMAEIADQIIVMERGKVVLQGTPREVYGQRELLENIGLETPAAMRFTKLLEERGISLPGSVMTMDETAEALLRLLRN